MQACALSGKDLRIRSPLHFFICISFCDWWSKSNSAARLGQTIAHPPPLHQSALLHFANWKLGPCSCRSIWAVWGPRGSRSERLEHTATHCPCAGGPELPGRESSTLTNLSCPSAVAHPGAEKLVWRCGGVCGVGRWVDAEDHSRHGVSTYHPSKSFHGQFRLRYSPASMALPHAEYHGSGRDSLSVTLMLEFLHC